MPRKLALLLAVPLLLTLACSKPTQTAKQPPAQPSAIKVDVAGGGPATITTATAEFRVLPSGYIQSSLLSNKLTLDEPAVGVPTDSDYIVAGGKEMRFVQTACAEEFAGGIVIHLDLGGPAGD